MIRQMCSFPETQMEFLEKESSRTGIPVTELLRSIVRQYIEMRAPQKEEKQKEN